MIFIFLPTEDQQYVIKFHLDGQAVTFKQISEINAQTMISALKISCQK